MHDWCFPLDAVPGPHGDQGQMLWNLWHVAESVLAGHDPYITDHVFYPIGAKLVTHTLVAGLFPLTIAVKVVADFLGAPAYLYPFVAFKLVVVASFWLLVLTTWLLFRKAGATPGDAVIPAVGYAFCSFYRLHNVHLNHLAGFFLPLSALALVALLRQPDRKRACWQVSL